MGNDREQLDSIELALVELRAAERAGVFNATRSPTTAVMRAGAADRTTGRRRIARRVMAVAAVLLLAVTTWTTMFRSELGKLREQRNAWVDGVSPGESGSMSFAACMSGPSVADIPAGCLNHDRNGDGFVDLQDYGAIQLASARMVP